MTVTKIEDLPPVQIGELMRGLCVGVVVESHNTNFVPGDFVQGMFGWQTHFITNATADGLTKLPPSPLPLEANLGLFGLAGMTAGWRCVAGGGLYGKWRSRGVLMKPPEKDYSEQP